MKMRTGRDGTYVHTRSGLTAKSRFTAGILVGSCFLLLILWFLFVSRFWSVRRLEIAGTKDVSRGEVEATVYDVLDQGMRRPWDQRNIFFIDKKQLAEDVKNKLFLESVIVDKVYPDVLRLLVEERQRRVVFGVNGQLLDVDPHGSITGEEPVSTSGYFHDLLSSKTLADQNHAPFVVQAIPADASSTQITTSTGQFVDADVVKQWLDASKTLLAAGLRYRLFKIEQPTSQTLKIVTEQGYDIVMDLRESISDQEEIYTKFMRSKPKDLAIHEYIDVRVPGKVYLK